MLQICLQMLESDEERSEFEKLYFSYRNLMFYIANNILHNEQLAEDAVSETFVKLAKNFNTILEFGDINSKRTKAYVAISVKNTALDIKTKEQRLFPIDEVEYKMSYDNEADELEKLIEAETYENILNEFNNLPDDARFALQSYAVFGHSISKIAGELCITEEGVKKKIYRARKLLKERLYREDEQ